MSKVENVYIVQRADGLVKIGYSASLEHRLAQLEKSHGPLRRVRILNGTRRREKAIHQSLRKHNEYGEWFRPSEELFDAIRALDMGGQSVAEKTGRGGNWEQIEEEARNEVIKAATSFYATCYTRMKTCSEDTFEHIKREHGIGSRVLRRLMNGEMIAPTYALLKWIRAAHLAEQLSLLSELKAEAEACRSEIANDQAEYESDMDMANSIMAVRERLQAKKGQAR